MKRTITKLIESLYIHANKYISSRLLKKYLTASTPNLSKQEWQEIVSTWGRLPINFSNNFHRIYKGQNGFEVGCLPEDVYNPIIRAALNPSLQVCAYENKAMYDILFKDIKQPTLIVKNIDGQFFEPNGKAICKDEAKSILMAHSQVIVKVCKYSDSGAGVSLFKNSNDEDSKLRSRNIDSLFSQYKANFVVQEKIAQHHSLSVFNPTSVNTIRITSLFLNGIVSIHSPIFRCGAPNSIVDNTGAGGIVVGIDMNGCLRDYGYDLKMNKHTKSFNGESFAGRKIEGLDKLEAIIKGQHKQMPTVHLIGWDFAIDENGEAIMLEINTLYPGIIFEQLCSGPIFGQRYNEVINYALANYPSLKISL